MNPATDWPALLLVGIGLVTGWILSSRGSGLKNLTETQQTIRQQAEEQAEAVIDDAQKDKDETKEQAEKAANQIDRAGLQKLAQMVRDTFGRK